MCGTIKEKVGGERTKRKGSEARETVRDNEATIRLERRNLYFAALHKKEMAEEKGGGEGDEDNRIGMWSTNPIQCCHAGQDLLLTPSDPNIDWGSATAVEESSWAKIKAQF